MATPPTIWASPSSGGIGGWSLGSGFGDVYVSYANGYWFAVHQTSASALELRVATDPTGTWTVKTLPAAPSGYTNGVGILDTGVAYGDGVWAFCVRYYPASGDSAFRVIHATDPTGTWSSYDFASTTDRQWWAIQYASDRWVISGRTDGTGDSTYSAAITYCTTIDGTYTELTDTAAGYTLGGRTYGWDVCGVVHDGTNFISTAWDRDNSLQEFRYCSTIDGTWSSCSDTISTTWRVRDWRIADTGRFTATQPTVGFSPGGAVAGHVWHTDDPVAGTWEELVAADFSLTRIGTLTRSDDYWVAVGATTDGSGYWVPRISYLFSSGSPTGTYTVVDPNFNEPALRHTWLPTAASGSGRVVAASQYQAQLKYSTAQGFLTTAPTYLRQRQSPVRAPSRVRPVQLRNRQTTMIR